MMTFLVTFGVHVLTKHQSTFKSHGYLLCQHLYRCIFWHPSSIVTAPRGSYLLESFQWNQQLQARSDLSVEFLAINKKKIDR